jgi:phage terminase Nu1 subunit (DNA packaging protein)
MIEGGIVTRKLLAHATGVSEPTVSKWVDQGMPCIDRGAKGKPAKFDLRECLAWWKDTIVLGGAKKPEKLWDREQLVDIETKELKLRQLKGELVERAAAVHVIRSMQIQTATQLRQAARRFGAKLVGLEDMASAVAVMSEIAEDQIKDLRVPELWQSIADTGDQVALEVSA